MANQQDGISVEGDSVITYNHVSDNGKSPSAYATGIHVSGAGSHIEGNQVRDNSGTGILATTADVIVRNSVGNNFTGNMATNFDPASGSNFAPIQTPATATNPFANISY